ncbi:MAG: sigma-70 family RNA polymerase sigma factor [bacterium]|nr:sigma-70 family RNA polymerase sigma factor [bacterium]
MKKSTALARGIGSPIPRAPEKKRKNFGHLAPVKDDLSSKWVKKPMRTQAEAERIFTENYPLLFTGIQKWGLNYLPNTDRDEILQQASISFFKSCLRWDETKGALSTYVITCMQECKSNFLADAGIMHFDKNRLPAMQQYRKWRFIHPEAPVAAFAEKYELSVERAEELEMLSKKFTHSLNPKRMGSHGYTISLKTKQRVENRLKTEELRRDIEKTLRRLKPQERAVVEAYYLKGDAGEIHNMGDIGETMGVSSNRVSQILIVALRKLRCSAHNKLLAPHFRVE